jgi:hypothetical protein
VKIVVFGPDQRVGALRGELIADLSLAYAKFLKERQNERYATQGNRVKEVRDKRRKC